MGKKQEIAITCVMPVYNSAAYLEMTMSSLCAQNFTNLEIICVDDASSDQSLNILQEFAMKDSRIHIIRNQEREGAAKSRNKGLKEAQGKYIIFLDSDDYFYTDMLQVSYNLIEEHDAELLAFGYEQVFIKIENDKEIECQLVKNAKEYKTYCNNNKNEEYYVLIETVPWNKLVSREFLLQQGIFFQDIPTNNDIFYSIATGSLAKKVVLCDRILMKHFVGRKGSITLTRQDVGMHFPEAYQYLLKFFRHEEIKCGERGLYNFVIRKIIFCICNGNQNSESKKTTIELFYQCTGLIEELILAKERGLLAPYAQEFVRRIELREDLLKLRYVECFIPGIKRIIEWCKRENLKIALWGCGKNGKELLRELELSQMEVDYVLDSDAQKRGSKIEKYVVKSFAEVSEKLDVVLVTTPRYYNEIKNIAIEKQVINLWDC